MNKKTILIGCDHAAVALKDGLSRRLTQAGWQVQDCGTYSDESVDYPDIANALCQRMPHDATLGILLCGSGVGMSIAANRYPYIRAALCQDAQTARLSREHNDANVLVMGARLLQDESAWECTQVFLTTAFGGGRHQRRVSKMAAVPACVKADNVDEKKAEPKLCCL